MPDKKLSDNEIIKALECCAVALLYDEQQSLYGLALDLINRQKAEIEALIAGQETLQRYISTAKADAIKEFAERLKEKSSKISLVCSGAIVKTDYTIAGTDLDNLVKERVGEDK